MTRNRILAIVVLLICSVVAVASWKGQSQTNTPDAFRFDAKNLNDTALWTKVNAAPYYISSQLDALCAGPTGMNYARERKYNPHAATFITVYVNAIGRSAMFEKESPLFPIGSVIVKHKIERTADHTTLLYTIMRTRMLVIGSLMWLMLTALRLRQVERLKTVRAVTSRKPLPILSFDRTLPLSSTHVFSTMNRLSMVTRRT
jgi:hypothetical protein